MQNNKYKGHKITGEALQHTFQRIRTDILYQYISAQYGFFNRTHKRFNTSNLHICNKYPREELANSGRRNRHLIHKELRMSSSTVTLDEPISISITGQEQPVPHDPHVPLCH